MTLASRLQLAALTALLLSSACSASVLIKKDDASFANSLDRYQKTRRFIDADLAAKTEAPFFMQAEGLYRYRFEPPPRSFGGYVAQAAAAAMDFPALQAIAASLDLFDLRLKTNDGAIQLWETMLERYPQSSLRPLILYRLGWAYRYKITSGFPREEPDEAFDPLIKDFPTSPLAALARESKLLPWKSPDAATAWSIIPGAGQIYAGETGNGLARIAVALVGAALIVVPSVLAYLKANRHETISTGEGLAYAGVGIGGLIVLSIDYTLAYQDALRATMQFNERQERRFEDRHPDAP